MSGLHYSTGDDFADGFKSAVAATLILFVTFAIGAGVGALMEWLIR